ncbi:MAG TPA: hypothetical protein DCS24_09845 [Erythrobacter sp.]|nr:hypothetical protein [Erythrobacter sp.]
MGSLVAAPSTLVFPAIAAAPLDIPSGSMMLGRKLERDLPGGAKIVVDRKWSVEFWRLANGIEVSGSQVSARVRAPEKLRELVLIEERRPTDGMFPIALSPSGLISRIGEVEDPDSMQAAVREAEEVIASLPHDEDEKADMRQAVARLSAASNSIIEVMPPELFFPNNTRFEDSRQMPLPDGSFGEFKVIYSANRSTDDPRLERAEREVLTRIGQDSQRSREVWTMQKP